MNAARRTIAALPAHRGSRPGDETAITHSIWTVGSCVAVGYDKANGAGGVGLQGLVETLSDGTWKPTAVPDVSSKQGMAGLGAVSCQAAPPAPVRRGRECSGHGRQVIADDFPVPDHLPRYSREYLPGNKIIPQSFRLLGHLVRVFLPLPSDTAPHG